jgi:acetolactate synthase I/II/III large subunit
MMNGIDYIAQILKQEGVEWMPCFPSNPLISAAARVGIRPVAFRHERGAVMAADGYSRVSDRQRFGVVAVQAQAGAENAMGGIAQAYADNIPVLVFLGGNNLDRLAVKPNFTAAQNYQGWVKQVEAIYMPNQVGDVMRRAFHALRNGRPGPVVVELTADVCAQEVPEAQRTYKSPKLFRQVPEHAAIVAAADALIGAKRGVIWAGAGVLFPVAPPLCANSPNSALRPTSGLPRFLCRNDGGGMGRRYPRHPTTRRLLRRMGHPEPGRPDQGRARHAALVGVRGQRIPDLLRADCSEPPWTAT